jgi:hypothetical protein
MAANLPHHKKACSLPPELYPYVLGVVGAFLLLVEEIIITHSQIWNGLKQYAKNPLITGTLPIPMEVSPEALVQFSKSILDRVKELEFIQHQELMYVRGYSARCVINS